MLTQFLSPDAVQTSALARFAPNPAVTASMLQHATQPPGSAHPIVHLKRACLVSLRPMDSVMGQAFVKDRLHLRSHRLQVSHRQHVVCFNASFFVQMYCIFNLWYAEWWRCSSNAVVHFKCKQLAVAVACHARHAMQGPAPRGCCNHYANIREWLVICRTRGQHGKVGIRPQAH
jgi:hypothetical protein